MFSSLYPFIDRKTIMASPRRFVNHLSLGLCLGVFNFDSFHSRATIKTKRLRRLPEPPSQEQIYPYRLRGNLASEKDRRMALPHLIRLLAHLPADLKLTAAEYAVAQVIARRINLQTDTWGISVSLISQDLKTMGIRTIERATAGLEAKGVITRYQPSRRAPYAYRLAITCPPECGDTNHRTNSAPAPLERYLVETSETRQISSETRQNDDPETRQNDETNKKLDKKLNKNLNTKNAGLVFDVFVSVLEQAFRETSDPQTIRSLIADKQNAYALAVELMERSSNPITSPSKWLLSVLRTNPSALLAGGTLKPSTGLTEAQKIAKLERDHSAYQDEKNYRAKISTDFTDYPNLKTFYLASYETYNGVNGLVVASIDAWLRYQRPDLPDDAKALKTGAAIDLQQHKPQPIEN